MTEKLNFNEDINLIVVGPSNSGKTSLIQDLKNTQDLNNKEGFIEYDYMNLTYMNKNIVVAIYEIDLEDIDILIDAKSKNFQHFKNCIFLLLVP